MKLSEAIMMNGMTKPQGFGADSMESLDAPCALGGALQVMGAKGDFTDVWRIWPWTFMGYGPVENTFLCPACSAEQLQASDVIWHLNDTHRWTRSQIAEWVATVEPQDISTPALPENAASSTAGAETGKPAPVSER